MGTSAAHDIGEFSVLRSRFATCSPINDTHVVVSSDVILFVRHFAFVILLRSVHLLVEGLVEDSSCAGAHGFDEGI